MEVSTADKTVRDDVAVRVRSKTQKNKVVREGWVQKQQAGRLNPWRKRWIVLGNRSIGLYKGPNLKEHFVDIEFSSVTSIQVTEDNKKKVLRLHVNLEPGNYTFSFENDTEFDVWTSAIRQEHTNFNSKKTKRRAGRPAARNSNRRSTPALSGNIVNKRVSLSLERLSLDSINMSDEAFLEDEESDDLVWRETEDEQANCRELFLAVERGNYGEVKARLRLGVNPDWKWEERGGRSALHAAARDRHRKFSKVLGLLLDFCKNHEPRDALGWTPLHIAAYHDNSHGTKVLTTDKSISLHPEDGSGRTPIYIAVAGGNVRTVLELMEATQAREATRLNEILLAALQGNLKVLKEYEKTADLTTPGFEGLTTLHFACCGGNDEVVSYLIAKSGRDFVKVTDANHKTPLHMAAASKATTADACIRILLKNDGDAFACDSFDKLPIHMAAGLGRIGALKALLRVDDNLAPNETRIKMIRSRDTYDFTSVHLAALHGQVECLALLLKYDEGSTNVKGSSAITPLFLAAHTGREECLTLLAKNGALVDTSNDEEMTALMEASRRGHQGCVSLLLGLGANVQSLDKDKNSALMHAVRGNHRNCVAQLLLAGANKDIANAHGQTVLWAALDAGPEMISALLESGVGPDVEHNHQTPLFAAATDGLYNSAKVLLDAGANCNATDRWGSTPLIRAISNGHARLAMLLLEAGADPNARTAAGTTALMEAAALGHVVCLDLLLESRVDVNAANNQGVSALHEAASNGRTQCLLHLLLMGAKLDIQDGQGKTPLQRAAESNHTQCALHLIANGAALPAAARSAMNSLMAVLREPVGKTKYSFPPTASPFSSAPRVTSPRSPTPTSPSHSPRALTWQIGRRGTVERDEEGAALTASSETNSAAPAKVRSEGSQAAPSSVESSHHQAPPPSGQAPPPPVAPPTSSSGSGEEGEAATSSPAPRKAPPPVPPASYPRSSPSASSAKESATSASSPPGQGDSSSSARPKPPMRSNASPFAPRKSSLADLGVISKDDSILKDRITPTAQSSRAARPSPSSNAPVDLSTCPLQNPLGPLKSPSEETSSKPASAEGGDSCNSGCTGRVPVESLRREGKVRIPLPTSPAPVVLPAVTSPKGSAHLPPAALTNIPPPLTASSPSPDVSQAAIPPPLSAHSSR